MPYSNRHGEGCNVPIATNFNCATGNTPPCDDVITYNDGSCYYDLSEYILFDIHNPHSELPGGIEPPAVIAIHQYNEEQLQEIEYQLTTLPPEERGMIAGQVTFGNGGFNNDWNWHFIPGQVGVASPGTVAVEICDTSFGYIDSGDYIEGMDHPDGVIDGIASACPWYAHVVGAHVISLQGDVNEDGMVNISDVVMVVNYVLGGTQLTEAQQLLADMDQNGYINITDIIMIVQQILGITAQQQSTIMNEVRRLLTQQSSRRLLKSKKSKPRFKTMPGRTGLKFTRQYRDKRR